MAPPTSATTVKKSTRKMGAANRLAASEADQVVEDQAVHRAAVAASEAVSEASAEEEDGAAP